MSHRVRPGLAQPVDRTRGAAGDDLKSYFFKRPLSRMVTLRQLRYLKALAETLHFGQAAEACAVTQPALSMQIKELEEVAGQPDRAPEVGDRANRAGRGDRQARAYHLASVRDVLSKHRERVLSGALKLGAIPSIAPYLLSVALPELQRRSPNLTLHLRETITETLVRELVSGDLDLILVALPSRVTRPLPAIRRCPFADW